MEIPTVARTETPTALEVCTVPIGGIVPCVRNPDKTKRKLGRPRAAVDAESVRRMAAHGKNNCEIAEAFGVHESTIRKAFASVLADVKHERRHVQRTQAKVRHSKKGLEQYAKNRKHWIERTRKWQALNPERVRVYANKQRVMRLQAEGFHTAQDIKNLLAAQRNRCLWCKKDTKSRYHVDHIIPLSRGGSDWPSNLCISCPECNMSKGAKMPSEFAGVLL